MPKLSVKMPSFEGVAKGATATLRLPIGRTYEKLKVKYSGVTLAQMKEIRLIGNGKTIQRWVGAAMVDTINQFEGMQASNGLLVLNMNRHGLKTRGAIEETALGTGVRPNERFPVTLTTLQLEIDIDAAATAPVLSCTAIQSAARPLNLIKKTRVYGYSPGAAGEFEISDLPKGDLISRIIFKSDEMDSLRIERDNRVIFDRDKTENEQSQTNGVRDPQDGLFIYDTAEEGYGSEALVTKGVHDLRFVLGMAAADNVQVTVEYLGYMER